jgi:hypothetical protein
MRMHYVLGRQVANVWKDNIFKAPIKPSEFEIHSSEYQRTQTSAISHAYGLFDVGTGLKTTNLDVNEKIGLPQFKDLQVSVAELGDFALPYQYRVVPIIVSKKKKDTLFMKGID